MKCPSLQVAIVAALASACGRLHFDDLGDAARGDAVVVMTDGGFVAHRETYVKASNTNAGDQFGFVTAISGDGNTLAVGATGESSITHGIDGDQTDNSAMGAGAVYIYTRAGASWAQQAYVKASNTHGSDAFGLTLALSTDGNTLAVGAFLEPGGSTGVNGDQLNTSLFGSGAAYVFTRSGTTWTQEAYVKASNPDVNDQFADSLALSGDGRTLAVAAYQEDSNATGIDGDPFNNNASDSGAVYVFTKTAGLWAQQAYLKASNAESGDVFGGVALSRTGDTLLVIAGGEDSAATGVGGDQADNSVGDSGAGYVFERTGSTWSQQAYLKASNPEAADHFGSSGRALTISADGTTVAIGAADEDSAASGVGGDQADNSAPDSGATYVFARTGATWAQQAYVKATVAHAQDQFGQAVALSADGSTLVVGAHFETSAATGFDGDAHDVAAPKSGAAYVYTRTAQTWSPRTYVKPTTTRAGYEFGFSVAIADVASVISVGEYHDASATTGVGGDPTDGAAPQSGAAYVIE